MSDTLSEEGEELVALSDVPSEQPRRTHLQQRIRQMLLGIFVLDAGVLFTASVIAWWYQRRVDDLYFEPPYVYHWLPLLGPGIKSLRLRMFGVRGGVEVAWNAP